MQPMSKHNILYTKLWIDVVAKANNYIFVQIQAVVQKSMFFLSRKPTTPFVVDKSHLCTLTTDLLRCESRQLPFLLKLTFVKKESRI